MLEILKSAASRRLLIWISAVSGVLLLIVVVVTAWFLEPQTPPLPAFARVPLIATQVVAGGLFGGVAAASFVAFVTRYLFKHDSKLEKISVLDALTTRREHLAAIDATDHWWHNGHIGRWVRTTVLPKFAQAVRDGAPRTVRFLILDPLNDGVIAAYAEHRDQVDAIPEGEDTRLDAQVEVLATILRAAHYQRVAGMEIEVWLRSDLNLFRVDVCTSGAFTTLTRDKAPAVEYRNDIFDADHYWAARKNFEYAAAVSRRLDLTPSLPTAPSPADVAGFLNEIGLGALSSLAESALKRSLSGVNRTP